MLHPPSKYNMNYLSNFLAIRNAATASSTMPTMQNASSSSSPPPLPPPPPPTSSQQSPLSLPSPLHHSKSTDLDETQLNTISSSAGVKSFTIAAILGLKKKNAAAAAAVAAMDSVHHKPNDLTVMNLSMHNNSLHMNQTTHNLLQHTQHPSLKTAFTAYDTSTDTRSLTNRLQLGFGQHLNTMPHHQASHMAHFHGTNGTNHNNNNNNNNNHSQNNNNNSGSNTTPNGNSNNVASALQSLQQQFHPKNSAFHATGREHKHKSDHVSKSKSSLKSKRVRTIFTPEQLERLEAEFERQQYMVGPERLYLAHTLQLTEAQVKVWFQNRRIKWRKHHLEITQQRLAIIRQHQLPIGATATASTTANGSIDSPPRDSGRKSSDAMPIAIESELSVCTDSMDSNSMHDVEDL